MQQDKNPKISIVMTHFNRAHLLKRTLHSFTYNKTRDFEIIIIDDGSKKEEFKKLKNLINEYKSEFTFRLLTIQEDQKWYNNPCIPFNIALKKAKGEIIIIQNPECMHVGNLIDFVNNRLDKFNADSNNTKHPTTRHFMTFACYNISKEQTESLSSTPTPQDILKTINPPNNRPITHCEEPGWYDHSIYRTLGYHWCNAIANEDFKRLKYFDERFAFGTAYDDDELAWRVKKILLPIAVDNPFVIHQWHGLGNYYKNKNQVENQLRQDYNRDLMEKITQVENKLGAPHNFDNVRNSLSEKVTYNEEQL